MFSAVYGGISRVKRHDLGVVGSILGKEMGKDWPRVMGLAVMHWAPAISICNTANGSAFGQRRTDALMQSYEPAVRGRSQPNSVKFGPIV